MTRLVPLLVALAVVFAAVVISCLKPPGYPPPLAGQGSAPATTKP